MNTFFTLQAVQGQREFAEVVVHSTNRERTIATNPSIVWIIDATQWSAPQRRGQAPRVCTFTVLGQEVVVGYFGRRSDLAHDLSQRVVENSVVVSHPLVRRLLRTRWSSR